MENHFRGGGLKETIGKIVENFGFNRESRGQGDDCFMSQYSSLSAFVLYFMLRMEKWKYSDNLFIYKHSINCSYSIDL